MANLTVRNVPTELYRSLQEAARRNGRSLNAEILALLPDEDASNRRRWHLACVIPRLASARRAIAQKYPNLEDTTSSVREDRNNR